MQKEAALHPPVKLTPEEKQAAKKLLQKLITEAQLQ